MATLRETINKVETKILPINHIDHRFRLEQITFDLGGISVQGRLLTSNDFDYSILCHYSPISKEITDWMMLDSNGTEYKVVGIVSKTLCFFAQKACKEVLETLGYEVD
ncbi:hypothetical protein [Tumebacillus flagellatus]|uniref:Uncharacterized protein n=1 Tax=Tumebacillus flagellatus TaxID=1157490 RepID=A0A074LP18_9BACL|nr:hypothetical protein [Tumebacillus flagellatus]KEO81573.1 hypothetical protein EL26_20020 [Tumebacillus flagellatus]